MQYIHRTRVAGAVIDLDLRSEESSSAAVDVTVLVSRFQIPIPATTAVQEPQNFLGTVHLPLNQLRETGFVEAEIGRLLSGVQDPRDRVTAMSQLQELCDFFRDEDDPVQIAARITIYVEQPDLYMQQPSTGFRDDDHDLQLALHQAMQEDTVFRGKPASASAIANLQRLIYGVDGGDGSTTCSICFDDYEVGALLRKMPCAHVFDEGCLIEWLHHSHVCPLCRFPLPRRDEAVAGGRC